MANIKKINYWLGRTFLKLRVIFKVHDKTEPVLKRNLCTRKREEMITGSNKMGNEQSGANKDSLEFARGTKSIAWKPFEIFVSELEQLC